MKTLTTEQIETLKTMDWQDDRGEDLVYFTNTNDSYFQDITGVCVSCLRELLGDSNTITSFYWEIAYRYHKDSMIYDLHYAIWCKGDVVKDGVVQEFDTDILGLFTKTEEKTDNPIERLKKALQECENNPDVEKADIQAAIEEFDFIYDSLQRLVLDNVGVGDLPDNLIEDCAKEWIEQNPDDAYDRAIENMYDSDVRDKVIDYINENLN